jgi:hypothetical protein
MNFVKPYINPERSQFIFILELFVAWLCSILRIKHKKNVSIKILVFGLSEKQVRRAGLDYWEHLDVQERDNWSALKVWL